MCICLVWRNVQSVEACYVGPLHCLQLNMYAQHVFSGLLIGHVEWVGRVRHVEWVEHVRHVEWVGCVRHVE